MTEEPQSFPMPAFAHYHHLANKGYAHCINQGIRYGENHGFEKFCVVNSDVVLSRNFVEKAKQSLSIHPSSLIGGKIYYASGYEYHKDRYAKKDAGNVLWYAGGVVDWDHAITRHRGVDEVDTGAFDTQTSTDFITGCLMLLDKKAIDSVGYFDESYFLYYEDADYGERAKQKHIPLLYDPSVVLWHKNSQSTQGAGSLLQQRLQRRNRLRFALAYAPIKTKLHVLINYVLRHD